MTRSEAHPRTMHSQ